MTVAQPSPSARGFWRRPDPFCGLALAAAAGILAADGFDVAPWTALGGCLAASLGWALRRRPPAFWLAVAIAFGGLHLFTIHGVPAETLAGRLPSNPYDPPARVRVVGRVLDEPRLSSTGASARFTFGLERAEVDGAGWDSQARVVVRWEHGAPVCGDRLAIIGAGRNIAAPRNPGEFDYADYERRQGIRSEIQCAGLTDVRVLARENRGSLRRTAVRFHDWMRDSLGAGLAPGAPPAAIISTMLLGLREDPGLGELEDLFQRTGTLHYFAIDGLKLALLSGLVLWTLGRCGVSRLWARTLSLPPLVFYAMATGLGPASLRATLTAGILLGAFWLERPIRPLNTLGAAATAILICDTNQLFDLGFQLTFTVVLALILFAGPLHRRLARWGAPDPFLPERLYSRARRWGEAARLWALGLVSVSLVAWAGSLPIMVLRFHVVSPVSPLANVATFPLAWLVLTLGVAALTAAAVGLLLPGGAALAATLNQGNALVASAFLAVAQGFDAVPAGNFYVPAPAEWTFAAPPVAELTALDLGLSRAWRLRAGGVDWLIDAAQPFEYARSVRPFLHAAGVNRLDGLILRQADRFHLGAAPLALADFRPRRVIDASSERGRSARRKDVLRSLGDDGRRAEIVSAGATIEVAAGVELRVLYPPPGVRTGSAADRALILQLRAAGSRVLLMGDAGAEAERWLLTNGSDLRSDALVGRDPRDAGRDFLRAVAPRLILSQTEGGDLNQRSSGALRLRVYPDRLTADGYVDGSGRSAKR